MSVWTLRVVRSSMIAPLMNHPHLCPCVLQACLVKPKAQVVIFWVFIGLKTTCLTSKSRRGEPTRHGDGTTHSLYTLLLKLSFSFSPVNWFTHCSYFAIYPVAKPVFDRRYLHFSPTASTFLAQQL